MRRILSILFTLVLSLGPAAASVPAQALASGWTGKVDESKIAACCRRNGVHHCTMPSGETALSASGGCPNIPQPLATAVVPVAALPSTGTSFLPLASVRSVLQSQAECNRFSDRHAHPKRGPPSENA